MGIRLAIAGATGLVGRQMLRIVEAQGSDIEALGLFASPSSAGERLQVGEAEHVVKTLADCDFNDFDAAFFCVGDQLSQEFVPKALSAGCAVVDKSGVYRLDPNVPLVVPGVNDTAVNAETRLIANPNCSTIVMLHALAPLARNYGLQSVFAATYQSVSGAGREAVRDLEIQSQAALSSATLEQDKLDSAGFAFNVLPKIGSLDEQGRCSEEAKLADESRKILSQPGLIVAAHAVRVPVAVGHGVAVTATFERQPELGEVETLWEQSPYLRIMRSGLPTPVSSAAHEQVEVGRLRNENGMRNTISFFCCGDNVNLGAALNGWRILGLLKQAGALRQAVLA